MTAYYNENDPFAAQWLRNLIAAGHIAKGDVDERSIVDVRPDDLRVYVQCHFFAGIGGWSHALRLAGCPDDKPVWTGSCPCQPFSAAGKRRGTADERHLWPIWFNLIRECRPPIIFGEQVASAIKHGWLDTVFDDLEGQGYACGAAVLPACSVGAPHIRQRLWFVGNANKPGRETLNAITVGNGAGPERASESGLHGELANSVGPRLEIQRKQPAWDQRATVERGGEANSQSPNSGQGGASPRQRAARAAARSNPWSDVEWIPCLDGKSRPAEPGIFPLAARIPGRVGQLRAYGNSIVSQVAAEFIRAATT